MEAVMASMDLNVLGKRAGQETEPVTTNWIPCSRASSASIDHDRLGFLTGSLAKYVTLNSF